MSRRRACRTGKYSTARHIDRARAWSACVYDAYPTAQGLWYASSMHANLPAVALYERAEDALPAHPVVHRPLADPALLVPLQRAAADLNYVLT